MLIHILNKIFTINDLKNGNFSLEGEDFVDNILIFCFEWLNGKEEFSMQSSGSTGTPKIITVKRAQMYESAKATGAILKLKKNNTSLICMNTDYIAGKMMLVRTLELKLDSPPDKVNAANIPILITKTGYPAESIPVAIPWITVVAAPICVFSAMT